jgi:hypothetical protein
MPTAWERRIPGLNPLLADNNGDLNGNGYTNLEEYLHLCAVGGTIPEPDGAKLALLSCLLAAIQRRPVRLWPPLQ